MVMVCGRCGCGRYGLWPMWSNPLIDMSESEYEYGFLSMVLT